jgi:hypothetical protein
MSPILIVSFLIPASIAFILIVLLIREREYLLPGKRDRSDRRRPERDSRSRFDKDQQNHDLMDLSGGTMGI